MKHKCYYWPKSDVLYRNLSMKILTVYFNWTFRKFVTSFRSVQFTVPFPNMLFSLSKWIISVNVVRSEKSAVSISGLWIHSIVMQCGSIEMNQIPRFTYLYKTYFFLAHTVFYSFLLKFKWVSFCVYLYFKLVVPE